MKRVTRYFYPLALMMPGDSFFVPCLNTDRIKSEVAFLARKMRVRVRMENEITDGLYGVRVWLI